MSFSTHHINANHRCIFSRPFFSQTKQVITHYYPKCSNKKLISPNPWKRFTNWTSPHNLLHCSCRCGTPSITEIKAIPNPIRNKDIVIKCGSFGIISVHSHALWLPTIISTPVEVKIANLVCARTLYLKCISWTAFKCSRVWIIQPWCIHLIPISIAKCKTDLISCVGSWRTACPYWYCVSAAPHILSKERCKTVCFRS